MKNVWPSTSWDNQVVAQNCRFDAPWRARQKSGAAIFLYFLVPSELSPAPGECR